jgi:hypothetical protein
MPDFDFDAYNHDNVAEGEGQEGSSIADDIIEEVRHTPTTTPNTTTTGEEVDKW